MSECHSKVDCISNCGCRVKEKVKADVYYTAGVVSTLSSAQGWEADHARPTSGIQRKLSSSRSWVRRPFLESEV